VLPVLFCAAVAGAEAVKTLELPVALTAGAPEVPVPWLAAVPLDAVDAASEATGRLVLAGFGGQMPPFGMLPDMSDNEKLPEYCCHL